MSTNKIFPGFKEKLRSRGYPKPVEDFEKPVSGEDENRGNNMAFIEAKNDGSITVLRFLDERIRGRRIVYDMMAPGEPTGKPEVRVYPPDKAGEYVKRFISRL